MLTLQFLWVHFIFPLTQIFSKGTNLTYRIAGKVDDPWKKFINSVDEFATIIWAVLEVFTSVPTYTSSTVVKVS